LLQQISNLVDARNFLKKRFNCNCNLNKTEKEKDNAISQQLITINFIYLFVGDVNNSCDTKYLIIRIDVIIAHNLLNHRSYMLLRYYYICEVTQINVCLEKKLVK